MSFLDALKRINVDSAIDALYWLFHTVFGGLLPIIITFILFSIFSRNFSFFGFAESGELIMFSASTLSAAYYTVNRKSNRLRWIFNKLRGVEDSGNRSFPGARGLGSLIYFITAVSAVIFAGALISEIPNTGLVFNKDFVRIATVIIFGLSIILGVIVTLVENSWSDLADEVSELFEQPIEKLGNQFDKLKKKGRK